MIKSDINIDEVEWLFYEEGKSAWYIADYYKVSISLIYNILNAEHKLSCEYIKEYYEKNKDNIKAKVGKYNHDHREEINIYKQTGLQGLRNKIRTKDYRNKHYQWLKRNLGDVHIHHEWVPGTAEYVFSALVDASEHMHDIINPIIFLEDNRIKLLQDSL